MAEAFITMYMPGILDYTALSLVTVEYVSNLDGIEGDTPERFMRRESVPTYEVPHLERMQGKAFREMIKRVQQIQDASALALYDKDFLLDVTHTGTVILDVVREEFDLDVVPVAVVGSDKASYDEQGRYRIPKTDLLTALIDSYQSGQIQVSKKLELAQAYDEQLRNIRIEPGAANDEGVSEDLVMSVAIGLWRAREEHSREVVYADRMNWEKDNKTRAEWNPLGDDV